MIISSTPINAKLVGEPSPIVSCNIVKTYDASEFPEFDYSTRCEQCLIDSKRSSRVPVINSCLDAESSDRDIAKFLWDGASMRVKQSVIFYTNEFQVRIGFYHRLLGTLQALLRDEQLHGKRPDVNYSR